MYGPKILAKLQQKKYRQEYGCFTVEGKKGVLDALNAGAEVLQLVVTENFIQQNKEYWNNPALQVFARQDRVLIIDESVFAKLADTTTPQGLMAVISTPNHTLNNLSEARIIAVLEDIRDPGNLGTMIRTADWFGLGGLILAGGADTYQPKVVRSSMGSLFHLPIIFSQNITTELTALKKNGFTVVVTRPELAATQNFQPLPAQKLCVVFGNESEGTSSQVDALADQSMSIPKFGQAESLNVAVSFGIVMHEISKHST